MLERVKYSSFVSGLQGDELSLRRIKERTKYLIFKCHKRLAWRRRIRSYNYLCNLHRCLVTPNGYHMGTVTISNSYPFRVFLTKPINITNKPSSVYRRILKENTYWAHYVSHGKYSLIFGKALHPE